MSKRNQATRTPVEPLESRMLLSAAATFGIAPLATFDFATTGAAPNELLLDPNTNILYGTTQFGGPNTSNINASQHAGSIFEILPNSNTITPLAYFNASNGEDPIGSIAEDSAGDLFGVADTGDIGNGGDVWQLLAGSASIDILGAFGGVAGSQPQGGITIDSDGDLFGTTSFGADHNAGAVFEYIKSERSLVPLASFPQQDSTDIDEPNTKVAVDSNGNVFGVHEGGGPSDAGYVYEVVAGSGTVTDIHDFTSSTGTPQAGLTIDSAGNIFGTTTFSLSSHNYGGIFEIPAGTTTVTQLAKFTPPDQQPGDLTIDSHGNIFGIIATENSKSHDAIFELPAGASKILTLATFAGLTTGNSGFVDVIAPLGVAVDSSGNIFGAFPTGGSSGDGIVYQAQQLAAKMAFTQQPTTTLQDNTILPPVTVTIEDANSQLVTTNTSSVTLTLNGPKGVTLGGTTTVAAVNGVATFNDLSLPTAGHYTLTATDSTVAKPAKSVAVTVTPIPISPHFEMLKQPADIALPGAFMTAPISVEVEDQFNHPVTKGFSLAKLSILTGPTGAKITGNTAPLKAGIATFTKLNLKTAGSYSLEVTDSTTPPLTLIDFNVLPGPAAKMVFATQPTLSVVALIDTTIELEDKFGNIAVNDTSAVSLAFAAHPKSSVLTGVLTENVIDGLATFTNLDPGDVAGTFTFKATDSNALPPATSKPFKFAPLQFHPG